MRRAVLVTFALGVVGAVSPAQANTIVCGGMVTAIAYHNPGIVMLQLSSMNQRVMACSVDSDWTVNGATTGRESCKALFAAMLAAKMSKTPISQVYFDGVSMPAACNGFEPWTQVSVRYYDL